MTCMLQSNSSLPFINTLGARWDGKTPGLEEMAWKLATTHQVFFHRCHFA